MIEICELSNNIHIFTYEFGANTIWRTDDSVNFRKLTFMIKL